MTPAGSNRGRPRPREDIEFFLNDFFYILQGLPGVRVDPDGVMTTINIFDPHPVGVMTPKNNFDAGSNRVMTQDNIFDPGPGDVMTSNFFSLTTTPAGSSPRKYF